MQLYGRNLAYSFIIRNSCGNHPGLARSRPVYRSDGRCNSSSAEAGVLMAITGQGLTPPVVGTHYHRHQPLLYRPGKQDPTYLSGGFSSTDSRCRTYHQKYISASKYDLNSPKCCLSIRVLVNTVTQKRKKYRRVKFGMWFYHYNRRYAKNCGSSQ
ncbi:hypothetical protein AVEN_14551-1 [Araneus ventricosus]|uniref:Uncharacterized protein n=1 Tax=Araneus ventricosus TaxID=182803 RepID=A0A4Y2CFP3_ARAVE|nr:hypothetical protein AVEN_14551-1 [Araneus ventricosus]